MRKGALFLAAALAIGPAAAFAGQPMMVHFDGKNLPMQEIVRVEHTPAGQVRVKTWKWESPQGNIHIVIQRSASALPSAYALQEMRSMQAQMQQLQNIGARLDAQAFSDWSLMPTLLAQPPFWMLSPVLPTAVIVMPRSTPTLPAPRLAPEADQPRLKV